MKRLMIGTLAVAGAALMAASALAGEGKGSGRGWDRMDKNGDGEITAEELSDKHADFIVGADADGSGGVSKEEMKAFHEAKRAERNPDKNGDGVVDRTEYVTAAQERFEKMDKDGNGVLSEDEMRRKHGRRYGRGEQE
jgi:Ca2+-binding EF-hand superfamily protein